MEGCIEIDEHYERNQVGSPLASSHVENHGLHTENPQFILIFVLLLNVSIWHSLLLFYVNFIMIGVQTRFVHFYGGSTVPV